MPNDPISADPHAHFVGVHNSPQQLRTFSEACLDSHPEWGLI